MARLSSVRAFSALATGYVNLFRSIPLVMVLLWFFLLVPRFLERVLGLAQGTDMRLASALVGFALFEAAYYAEIIRAGIQSVSKGQVAAAQALGMTGGQSMRAGGAAAGLPQHGAAAADPGHHPLPGHLAGLRELGLADFFGAASKVGDRDGRLVELLLFAGAVYFVICFATSQVVRRFQRRLAHS